MSRWPEAAGDGVTISEDILAFALQQLPPAPGQGTTAPAPTPEGAPPAGPPPGLGMWLPLLVFLPMILLMFWSSRSQQKRHQKALAELKKGDWVLTQAGLRGTLVELGDRSAKLELAPGVKVDVLKSSLLGKDTVETAAQLEKK